MSRWEDPFMTCEECGIEAAGQAWGWQAHMVDLDDDGIEDDVLFYCATCAEGQPQAEGHDGRNPT